MPKTVLIADPDLTQGGTLAAFFEAMGWKVASATTPERLHRALESQGFDLLVSDWALPPLQGEELFQLLKTCQKPVALFTAREGEPPQDLARRHGLDAGFAKARRSELLRWVSQFGGGAPAPPPTVGAHPAQGLLSFMVIEDSPTIRGFVRRVLGESFPACHVLECEDGRAAITRLTQERVHGIISDLEMPGMDGWTFLATLRQNPVLKAKPVLILSSSIDPARSAMYKDDKAIRFLAKPATAADIKAALEDLMGKGQVAGSR